MSGPAARIEAQAKINLHLRVFDRGPSGYHSIETIFCRIELSDRLTIRATNGARILDIVPAIPGEPLIGGNLGPVEKNLAFRAATAYRDVAGWPRGFEIELTKWIDIGAGLGGGSADAAAVLRALNSIAPSPLTSQQLHTIAAELGADVPFLVSGYLAALGVGRGDTLTELPSLPQKDLLLVIPPFPVPTKDAYAWIDEDRRHGLITQSNQSCSTNVDDLDGWDRIFALAQNDFLEPVGRRYPVVHELVTSLRNAGAIFASMTGSGAGVFGVYDSFAAISDRPAIQEASTTRTRTAASVVDPVRVE